MNEGTQHALQKVTDASVLIAAVATIPVVILQERGLAGLPLVVADWIIWGLFAFALGVDLFFSRSRLRHLRTHMVDLAIVVLSFPLLPAVLALTRLVRLTRIFRVFRLARLVGVTLRVVPALKATLGRHELIYVAVLCGFVILVGGALLNVIEPQTVEGSLQNAVWWAVVTATTVGYGDISPGTTLGRVVAVIVMFCGVGLISTLSASIAAYFVDQGNESALTDIQKRLERIESALKEKQK